MRTIRPTILSLIAAAAVAFAFGACVDSTSVNDQEQFAAFNVAITSSGGGFVVTPIGLVFQSTQLTFDDSRQVLDTCLVSPVTPTTTPAVSNIGGGDSIAFTTGGVTSYLKPVAMTTATEYVLPAAVPIVPGAQFTLATPGVANGFPAMSVMNVTPPQLTLNHPALQSDGSLQLTWNAGDDSSRVTIALEYAPAGSTALDTEIFCTLNDDGGYTIPAATAAAFDAATTRLVLASRWRTVLSAPSGVNGPQVYIFSEFDQPPFVP